MDFSCPCFSHLITPALIGTHRESRSHGSSCWSLSTFPKVLIRIPRRDTLVVSLRGADKSMARPTSRCILFDGENISFDASLFIYINNTNIHPIIIINRIYETQNLLSLKLVSFLVELRTYQHPCKCLSKTLTGLT